MPHGIAIFILLILPLQCDPPSECFIRLVPYGERSRLTDWGMYIFQGGVVNPAVTQFENDLKAFAGKCQNCRVAEPSLMHIAANPSCDASQEPYDRRRSQSVPMKNMEAHRKAHRTRHVPAYPHTNDNKTIEPFTNISIAARASTTDPDTLSRLVDAFYPLLAVVYMNTANPNLGSLNTDQLAQSEAFAHTSLNTWGNVSLAALSNRLHYTQQGNYASEGPPDPRVDVLDMICEATDSNADTLGMLVLANSVCLNQKCGTTSSACSTRSARRDLGGLEVLIDEDEGDDVDDELLRRTFDQVSGVCLTEFRRFSDNQTRNPMDQVQVEMA